MLQKKRNYVTPPCGRTEVGNFSAYGWYNHVFRNTKPTQKRHSVLNHILQPCFGRTKLDSFNGFFLCLMVYGALNLQFERRI